MSLAAPTGLHWRTYEQEYVMNEESRIRITRMETEGTA